MGAHCPSPPYEKGKHEAFLLVVARLQVTFSALLGTYPHRYLSEPLPCYSAVLLLYGVVFAAQKLDGDTFEMGNGSEGGHLHGKRQPAHCHQCIDVLSGSVRVGTPRCLFFFSPL